MKNVVRINFQKIKKTAKDKGLSTRAIAREAGDMSHNAVYSVLTGTTSPLAVNVKKVCDVIGLPIQDAFITKRRAA